MITFKGPRREPPAGEPTDGGAQRRIPPWLAKIKEFEECRRHVLRIPPLPEAPLAGAARA